MSGGARPTGSKPIGALLGAGLGFLIARGPGAVVGLLAGQLFQQQMRRGRRAPAADAIGRAKALVGLAAALAECDGEISAAEREAIRTYFQRDAGLPQSHLLTIDRMIDRAVTDGAPAPTAAAAAMPPLDPSDRIHVLFVLFRIALADGGLNGAEDAAMTGIAAALGVSADDLRSVRAQFVTSRDRTGEPSDYELLGVEPGADEARVKERFREVVKEIHPDKFEHLGEEFTAVAQEKFKKVQEAYERISSGRSSSTTTHTRRSICARCRAFSPAAQEGCPRCGAPKFEIDGERAHVRCPFCTRKNAFPRAALQGEVRCGNCKVLLVR